MCPVYPGIRGKGSHECVLLIGLTGSISYMSCLSVRVVRDTPSTTTDDRIEQFIAAFNDLKWKFGQGINVQALIIAHRLDSALEGLSASGKIGSSSCVA